MAVDDPTIIDEMGISQDDPSVLKLYITDFLNWDEEGLHLIILQNKVIAYFNFIDSGQAKQSFPDSEIESYIIELHMMHGLVNNAMAVLGNLAEQMAPYGVKIQVVLDGGERGSVDLDGGFSTGKTLAEVEAEKHPEQHAEASQQPAQQPGVQPMAEPQASQPGTPEPVASQPEAQAMPVQPGAPQPGVPQPGMQAMPPQPDARQEVPSGEIGGVSR